MAAVYGDYTRDRVGMFFGLTGVQLGILVGAGAPALWAFHQARWRLLGLLVLVWAFTALLVVVPVRGRSATGWMLGVAAHGAGLLMRWSPWRANAAKGRGGDVTVADLPGVLSGIRVHDGPPSGPSNTRVALIQNHAGRSWAVTAAISHPGLALSDHAQRDTQGRGLTALLNACARTEMISQVILMVRTTPEDGAERQQWLATHQSAAAPALARSINDELAISLARASVRTEQFVTVVVPESALARQAKEFGAGIGGRARALSMLTGEVTAQLRDQLGVQQVDWLTSPQLAAAVRTGFAPGDRAGIVEALAAKTVDGSVNADVPWSQAGPSSAETAIRHYRHDAWHSIAATLRLPDKGAVMGALAPVLVPTEPGERRSLTVVYPVVPETVADRQALSGEWKADMAETLRGHAGIKSRARDRTNLARTRNLDMKLASGNALIRPYAVACVTVPATQRIAEYGRRLDASIRRAGFAPLRLDLSQDAGFAAATIPLGVTLDQNTG